MKFGPCFVYLALERHDLGLSLRPGWLGARLFRRWNSRRAASLAGPTRLLKGRRKVGHFGNIEANRNFVQSFQLPIHVPNEVLAFEIGLVTGTTRRVVGPHLVC